MAASSFKLAQEREILLYVDHLIRHVSRLNPDTDKTNYDLAEQFILSNIHAHTFLETNENEVRRTYSRLLEKMQLHNISLQRIDRLKYLRDEFLKRPLRTYTKSGYQKQTYSGLSDTHHSVLRLLLLLGESPTAGENGLLFKEDCDQVST